MTATGQAESPATPPGKQGPPAWRDDARRHLRRNTVLAIGEVVAFSLAMAFFDQGTVIPGFISALTGSTIFLGLAPTVFQLGLGLPQLAVARFVGHRLRKMPFLIGASVARNLPFFILAAVTWSRPGPGILLLTFFLCYLAFAIGMGMESIAWMDIFAKVFPNRERNRVMALARTIASVLAVGAGFLVSRVLAAEGGFPRNFALLFLIAGGWLTLALLLFSFVHEPVEADATADELPDRSAVLAQGWGIWRADSTFRHYFGARFAYIAFYVALPFFFRFARDVVGIEETAIGHFVSAAIGGQIVANIIWGYIGTRYGSKRVVQGILVLGLLLPLYVLLTPRLPQSAFLLVYVVVGIIQAGDILGWMNLLLAIAPSGRRTLYVSLQGTLLIPANLLPLVGGIALRVVPLPLFFGLVTLAFGAGLWLVRGVRDEPAAR